MNKKCFIPVALSLLLFGVVFAGGIQIGVDAGYGFSAGKHEVQTGFHSIYNGYGYYNIQASYGNGIKLNLDVTIFFNENLSTFIGTGCSLLGSYKLEKEQYSLTEIMRANYLPVFAGIKLQDRIGKLCPYIYLAPGIVIPFWTEGEDNIGEPSKKDKITTEFAPGFGMFTGIGTLVNLSDKFGIKFECSPTYAFCRLKEYKVEYNDGTKKTLIFIEDEKDVPDNTNDKVYWQGAPMYSFCSIAAKVGIIINIGK